MDKYIALSILLFIKAPLLAQDTGQIVVEVTNVKSPSAGPLYLMLFDTKEGFPREIDMARQVVKLAADNDQLNYTFESLPYGRYALSIFQDQNGNRSIDSNFAGFPKEPIGASNMERLGRPSFDKCQILLDQPSVKTQLKFLIN